MTDKTIPAWVDMARLCEEICASPNTVDSWCAQGILPPPRKRGGKLMWKWAEVDELLTNGRTAEQTEIERIRAGTLRALQETRQ